MRERPGGFTRREFVGTTLSAAAVLGACGQDGLWGEAELESAGKATATLYPIHVPPTVSPTGLSLAAAPATVDTGGRSSAVLAYNGYFPGPTIRAARGSGASVTLQNGLTQESTIHWHGMVVPTAADGHPRDAVPPGGQYLYQYTIAQRAAMNWYHPHPHMLTGEQVALGLAGAFIVEDAEEAALGLPAGAYEVPLVLRDANFDRRGNIVYNPPSSGYLGNTPLVNGTRNAKLDVDTAIYRLRILNGANARVFRLAWSDRTPFFVIGNDGGLLASAVTPTEIWMGPAERLDVLVDLRGLPVGATRTLRCLDARWDLVKLVVVRSVQVAGTLPVGPLSTIAPLPAPTTTRDFSFDGMNRINGLEYDLARIDFQVPLGTTELWRFSTNGNAPHPVHVLGGSFQVLSRSGGRGALYPWESGWKDTVLLLDGETVEIAIRFEAFRGLYLLHCHKLEHEDMGMMSNFEVV